jgi:hypothetical protein
LLDFVVINNRIISVCKLKQLTSFFTILLNILGSYSRKDERREKAERGVGRALVGEAQKLCSVSGIVLAFVELDDLVSAEAQCSPDECSSSSIPATVRAKQRASRHRIERCKALQAGSLART